MIPVPPPCFLLELVVVVVVELDSPVPFLAGSLDGPEPWLEVELVDLGMVTLGLDFDSSVLVPPVRGWLVDIPVAWIWSWLSGVLQKTTSESAVFLRHVFFL